VKQLLLSAGILLGLVLGTTAQAQQTTAAIDRAVVRFHAPELGGVAAPRYVFERELAFEARIELLSESQNLDEDGYPERVVKAALARHVAETILEALPVSPPPTPRELSLRVIEARLALEQRVGGGQKLSLALEAEGLEARELYRVLQRQARASIYLDRMVAPMLEPTQAEMRLLHQAGRTPFSRLQYEKVQEPLRRWLVASRLQNAIASYYEAARGRIQMEVVQPSVETPPSRPTR
jgi:hypothetical protein